MAYTHFGELEIKPTSPIPTHMAYTHLGELEIKPTPIPLPIPNHGIYYHFGEIQTSSSPQLIYLWEVYLGVVAKVAFYMRI